MAGKKRVMDWSGMLANSDFATVSTLAKAVYLLAHGVADDEGRLTAVPALFAADARLFDMTPPQVESSFAELAEAGLVALYGNGHAFVTTWPDTIAGRKFIAASAHPLPPIEVLDRFPGYRDWVRRISAGCKAGAASDASISAAWTNHDAHGRPDYRKFPRYKSLWPERFPAESTDSGQNLTAKGETGREQGENRVRTGCSPTPTPSLGESAMPLAFSPVAAAQRARRGAATAKRSDATAPEQAMPRPGNLALPPRASDAPGQTDAYIQGCATDAGAPPAAAAPAARGRATAEREGSELHLDGRTIALLRSMIPGRGKPTWHHGTEDAMPADVVDRIEAARRKILAAGYSPAAVQELLGAGHGKIREKTAAPIVAASEILAMRAAEDAALRAGARSAAT